MNIIRVFLISLIMILPFFDLAKADQAVLGDRPKFDTTPIILAPQLREKIPTLTPQKIYASTPKTPPIAQSQHIKSPQPLPQQIINISLSNYTAYFNDSYEKVFINTLSSIEKSPLSIVSYDTKSGRIFCNYQNVKGVYVLVAPVSSKTIITRITPADGEYNLSQSLVNGIFENIRYSLNTIINQ